MGATSPMGQFIMNYGAIIFLIIGSTGSLLLLIGKLRTKYENDISNNATNISHNYNDIQKIDLVVRDHDKDIAVMQDNVKGIHISSAQHNKNVEKINETLQILLIRDAKK
jgi:hypothetical protein